MEKTKKLSRRRRTKKLKVKGTAHASDSGGHSESRPRYQGLNLLLLLLRTAAHHEAPAPTLMCTTERRKRKRKPLLAASNPDKTEATN